MSAPEHSDKPRFAPVAGRRNFKLSGLEMLIVALIILGLAYLITMWAGSAFGPDQEAAAPVAAPGPLMEQALASSEKALAQLSSLGKDLGSVRKEIEDLRARRATAAPGQPAAHSDGVERRLEDMEKQVKSILSHRDDKALAALAQEIKATAGRLERLEKDLAAKAQVAKAAAGNPPEADPRLLARIERLEQALSQSKPQAGADLGKLEQRLDRLERGLDQAAATSHRNTVALEKEAQQRTVAQEPRPEVKAPPKVVSRPAPVPKPQPEQRKLNHKVRPGETILGLARKYKVNMDDIVRWNASQLGERRQLLIGETIVIVTGNNS